MRNRILKKRIAWFFLAAVLLTSIFSLCGCEKKALQITDISQLNGHYVAVELGSVHANVIKASGKMDTVKPLYIASSPDGLAMLLTEKVDAFVTDNVLAHTFDAEYKGLMILDEQLDESHYSFAFAKGSPYKVEFDHLIQKYKSSGVISSMQDIWLGNDESLKKVPVQDWSGANGTIRCVVNPAAEPMCYVADDGSFTGFEVDLALRIAKDLDYKLEFTDYDFAELLPYVASNQYDMALSAITETEERAQSVDFSKGYIEAGTVVMVRDASHVSPADGMVFSVKNSLRKTFVEEARWKDLLKGLWVSTYFIVVAGFLGFVLAVLFFLWAYSGDKIGKFVLKGCVDAAILLPASSWLYLFYYIFFARLANRDAFAVAIISLSLNLAFFLYNDFCAAINSIPEGEVEAAVSMGYGKFQALFKIFVPRAKQAIIGSIRLNMMVHIKSSSLIGLVAIRDIQMAVDIVRANTLEPFVPIILSAAAYCLFVFISNRICDRISFDIFTKEKTKDEIMASIMKGAKKKA